jgi:uncharacterized protein
MTAAPPALSPLGWEHAVADVPAAGLSVVRAAEPGEREAVMRALDLLACPRLEADYTLIPTGAGRYRLRGNLRCEVVQACRVTLEPVASTIAEELDVPFWPVEEIPLPRSGALDLDGAEDPEPIAAGRVAVGRLFYECLAAALDPFPRQPGAVLENSATPSAKGSGGSENPFAILTTLRDKR